MDRRQFLMTGGAALCLPFINGKEAGAFALAQTGNPSDRALDTLFERIFQEQVRTSPVTATYLGLDKGELAPLRSRLDTRPIGEARREEAERTDKFIGWLEAVSEQGLSDAGALNREVVLWDLKTSNVGPRNRPRPAG